MASRSSDDQENDFGKLDFRKIKFPSDGLTVAMLRAVHPDLFDLGFYVGSEAQPRYFLQASYGGHAEDGVGNLLFCERLVATWAFASAQGKTGPLGWDLEEARDQLVDFYRQYGLASGIKHATELIREIERQGQHLGEAMSR